MIHESMSLAYEPASESLHIYVRQLPGVQPGAFGFPLDPSTDLRSGCMVWGSGCRIDGLGLTSGGLEWARLSLSAYEALQGYLAHKKQPSDPRTTVGP